MKRNLNDVSYTGYDEIGNELKKLAGLNPDLTKFEVIAHSSTQKEVHQLMITEPAETEGNDGKVHIGLIGGLNGNEPVGVELILRMARHLLEGISVLLFLYRYAVYFNYKCEYDNSKFTYMWYRILI